MNSFKSFQSYETIGEYEARSILSHGNLGVGGFHTFNEAYNECKKAINMGALASYVYKENKCYGGGTRKQILASLGAK